MKKIFLPAFFACLLVTGCSNTGAFLSGHQTIVNLNEGNYSVTATNISGQSEAAYVLGVSYSAGLVANTFAIARVQGTGLLYAEALEDLWENYAREFGDVADNRIALTNVRYDTDMLNLLVYTRIRITVRADVIEFD